MLRSHGAEATTLVLCGLLVACWSPDPYSANAVSGLYTATGGSKLAGLTRDGRLVVWSLAADESGPPKIVFEQGPSRRQSVALLDVGGEAVFWNCGGSELCSRRLSGGSDESVFMSGHGDTVSRGVASDDGRLVVGTDHGAVVEIRRDGAKYYKRVDRWSPGGPVAIYTLEGSRDLGIVVSAAAEMGLEAWAKEHEGSTFNAEEGWFEFRRSDGEYRREPLWLSPVAWKAGQPWPVAQGMRTRVRAAVSVDGAKFAVKEEGGLDFLVFDGRTMQVTADLSRLNHRHCNGLQFLDESGRFLASVAYTSNQLSLVDLESPSALMKLALRQAPAGGARVLATIPARRWVFVGLPNAAVDWYEFREMPKPALVFRERLFVNHR